MTQEIVQPRKRRGPKPTGKGTPVQVRLQPELERALDEAIAREPAPKPSRPEMIRRAVAVFLRERGILK